MGELFEACETRQAQTEAEHAGGLVVAVKKMIKQSRDQTIQFLKEAQNVCELDHPNVVKLKGIVMAGKWRLQHAHTGYFASCAHRILCFMHTQDILQTAHTGYFATWTHRILCCMHTQDILQTAHTCYSANYIHRLRC